MRVCILAPPPPPPPASAAFVKSVLHPVAAAKSRKGTTSGREMRSRREFFLRNNRSGGQSEPASQRASLAGQDRHARCSCAGGVARGMHAFTRLHDNRRLDVYKTKRWRERKWRQGRNLVITGNEELKQLITAQREIKQNEAITRRMNYTLKADELTSQLDGCWLLLTM